MRTLAVLLTDTLPFLAEQSVVVIWIDSQLCPDHRGLRSILEKRGFRIEAGTRCETGLGAPTGRRPTITRGLRSPMPRPRTAISSLTGFAPAIPTPFDAAGAIDGAALTSFCDRQIEEGASALTVCGTTGEAPTLTHAEPGRIVGIAVKVAHGRVPVIAGAGSNSTSQAIELAKDAEAAGADAILLVVPYYNKPVQRGLQAHFEAIAGAMALPIILYDVPSRTACGLADSTIAALAENPQFVGLKDATGNMARPLRLRALVPRDFRLLPGDDATAVGFMAQGGHGCISVASNVAPGLCRRIHLAMQQGRSGGELPELAAELERLTRVLFSEVNPVPVKLALSVLKWMPARVRLPLVEASEGTRAEILSVLADTSRRNPSYLIGGSGAKDFAAETDREFCLRQAADA
jgi:4-hydroxy-tetrahydrodipicolinate synthase